MEILGNRSQGVTVDEVRSIMTVEDVGRMIDSARNVYVSPALLQYVASICAATRRMDDLRLGVSPRGALALVQICQTYAATQGRDFVTADDVKASAPYVLAHRMLMTPESELEGKTAKGLLSQVLAAVPVPQERVEA